MVAITFWPTCPSRGSKTVLHAEYFVGIDLLLFLPVLGSCRLDGNRNPYGPGGLPSLPLTGLHPILTSVCMSPRKSRLLLIS
uniref:Uncharacterized protein n=1 Tax=Spermophilus dauricus TaxID=99837 RepID=A0A8C9Q6Q3_SPEDA